MSSLVSYMSIHAFYLHMCLLVIREFKFKFNNRNARHGEQSMYVHMGDDQSIVLLL